MAGLADLVKNVVAVADRLTTTLQVEVLHHARSEFTVDAYEKVTPGPAVRRLAVVEPVRRQFRSAEGDDLVSKARVTFPRPVEVSALDIIVLPDGTTGPILDVAGVTDPTTGRTYTAEVWIGENPR